MDLPRSNSSHWFAQAVQPHETALRAWLRARFPDLTEVDDVVQEAFVRVLRAQESGPIFAVKSLLFTAAKNLALNRLRDGQRDPTQQALAHFDLNGVCDCGASIPETVARLEEFSVLLDAIKSLPTRCRQVMTLRRIYGLSQKEVAVRLGIAEHTVEAQSVIGLNKCVIFFRAHGHEPHRP